MAEEVGQLNALAPAATVEAGNGAEGLAVSPDGKHLYVACRLANYVSAFSLGTNGALTAIANYTSAEGPLGLCISEDGKFVFAGCNVGVGHVTVFSRDAETGVLTAVESVESGTNLHGVGISPDGKWLFACDYGAENVHRFEVESSGKIRSLGTTAAGTDPHDCAVSPDGKNLYVCESAVAGHVRVYTLNDTTGELTEVEAKVAGEYTECCVVSPDGKFVYATNYGGNTVSQFSRNESTGALTALTESTVATGTGPEGICITADGLNVYVSDFTASAVSQYTRDLSTGVLKAITPASVTAGSGAARVARSPSGDNVYTGNRSTTTVSQFARAAPLSGLVAGMGTLTGTLEGKGPVPLDGTIAAVGTASASLSGVDTLCPLPSGQMIGLNISLGWGAESYADAGKMGVHYMRMSEESQTEKDMEALVAAGVRPATVLFGEGGSIGALAEKPEAYLAKIVAFFKAYGYGGTFWAGNKEREDKYAALACEVLNEPGGSWFWSDPENYSGYTSLLKDVYETLTKEFTKGNRPWVLASYDGGHNDVTFGNEIKALGAMSFCDAVTAHNYKKDKPLNEGNRLDIEECHKLSGKPVWNTELGWTTALGQENTGDSEQISEAEQAEAVQHYGEWVRSKGASMIQCWMYFCYHDFGTNNWYGVETLEGVHKPSFAKLGEQAALAEQTPPDVEGTISGTGTASGTLSVAGTTVVPIAGTVVGSGTAAAALSVKGPLELAGSVTARGALTGLLNVETKLTGPFSERLIAALKPWMTGVPV